MSYSSPATFTINLDFLLLMSCSSLSYNVGITTTSKNVSHFYLGRSEYGGFHFYLLILKCYKRDSMSCQNFKIII